MDLNTILRLRSESRSTQSKANEELANFSQAILDGKATTGDPVTDFLVAHGVVEDKENEQKVRSVAERLSGAAGKEVLAGMRITYVWDAVICHGFGGRPEYHSGEFFLKRFGTAAGDPVWSPRGVSIPMRHYAFSTSHFFRDEEGWTAEKGPLVLSALELLDYPLGLYRYLDEETRQRCGGHLPQRFWVELNEAASRRERVGVGTTVYVGDEVEQGFENYALGLLPDMKSAARFCAKHGMNRTEHRELRERTLAQKRGELIVRIEEAVASEPEMLPRLLRSATRLKMHEIPATYEKTKGVRVDVPERIEALCEEYKIPI